LVIVITVIGGAVYAYSMFIDQSQNLKKQTLIDIANNEVNIESKLTIRSKINTLNSKFTIYQDVNGQNFDVNEFYTDLKALYPASQIQTFTARPDAAIIEAEILIPNNGYTEFPKFLDALNKSARFPNSRIKNVVFEAPTGTAASTSQLDVPLKITVQIPKESLNVTNTINQNGTTE
jgi:hypothetical protein